MQRQMDMSDTNPEYEAFVDKFKPKLTTDDCYTPESIYQAVRGWVFAHYGLPDNTPVIRPFWPGYDYRREDYPDGCVVIDNPPFSILSQIEKFYLDNGVRFFLFAPALSLFKSWDALHYVLCGADVTFENGANVKISFVANLGEYLIETAPDLNHIIKEVNKKNVKKEKAALQKYEYPIELATAARIQWLAIHGITYRVKPEDAHFVRKLDEMGCKGIFGAGFLLSQRASAERAAAENAATEHMAAERAAAELAAKEKLNVKVWKLSTREKEMIKFLGTSCQCCKRL